MRNFGLSPLFLGYLGFLLTPNTQVVGIQVNSAETAKQLRMDGVQFMKQANSRLAAIIGDDDDDDYSCSKTKECSIGCCGPLNDDGVGVCGMGPDYCGDDCFSNCDAKSEVSIILEQFSLATPVPFCFRQLLTLVIEVRPGLGFGIFQLVHMPAQCVLQQVRLLRDDRAVLWP